MRGGSAAASQEQRPELTVVCRRGNGAQVLWGGGNWEGSPPRGMWPWTPAKGEMWPVDDLGSLQGSLCTPLASACYSLLSKTCVCLGVETGLLGAERALLPSQEDPILLEGRISARSRMGTADINSPCEWEPPPPLSSQDCCPVLPAPFVYDPFSHKPRMSLLLSQGSCSVLEPRQ